jgi:hypothetical protein
MGEMFDRTKRVIRAASGDVDVAARTVLRELRTPSPEMLVAAAKLPMSAAPSDVWEAMMAAAD